MLRVVNMSMGGSVKEYEDDMERCAVARTLRNGTHRREWFEVSKAHWGKAMLSAPEILFVVTSSGVALPIECIGTETPVGFGRAIALWFV